jgi:uncharacterized protein with PhoU and TrkA domain
LSWPSAQLELRIEEARANLAASAALAFREAKEIPAANLLSVIQIAASSTEDFLA